MFVNHTQPPTTHKMSQIERLFEKYEHLAYQYAARVTNFHHSAMEHEDIIQEMRIKIYMSILGYGRKWKAYRNNEESKPVPLQFWLRSALIRKTIDVFKAVAKPENSTKVEIVETDVSHFSDLDFEIDVEEQQCFLNEIDLIAPLSGERRRCFVLYVYGYTLPELIKEFPDISVSDFIQKYLKVIKKTHKRELLDFTNERCLYQPHKVRKTNYILDDIENVDFVIAERDKRDKYAPDVKTKGGMQIEELV